MKNLKSWVLSCDACFSKLADADVTSPPTEWAPLTVWRGIAPSAEHINTVNCCRCQRDRRPCLEADMILPLVENHRDFSPLPLNVIIVPRWPMCICGGLKAFHLLPQTCGFHSRVNHRKVMLCLLRWRNHICVLLIKKTRMDFCCFLHIRLFPARIQVLQTESIEKPNSSWHLEVRRTVLKVIHFRFSKSRWSSGWHTSKNKRLFFFECQMEASLKNYKQRLCRAL